MVQNTVLKRMKAFLAPRTPVFIDPDTHKKFTAKTKVELVQRITMYRAQNDLEPIENLNLVLDNFWASLPENKGLTENVTLERGFLTYVKGGITLVKTMVFSRYTTQEEADRRGKICTTCPENVDTEKSEFMSWSDTLAEHTLLGRRSEYHDKLGNCAVCTCVLKTKVWADMDDIVPSKEENDNFPDFCWNKR